jgi:hypothetical protein
MVDAQKKISKFEKTLEYFPSHSWNFDNGNFLMLQSKMSLNDNQVSLLFD